MYNDLKSAIDESNIVTNIVVFEASGINGLPQFVGSIFSEGTRFANTSNSGYTWSYIDVTPGCVISFTNINSYTCEFASAFEKPNNNLIYGSITGVAISGQENARIVCPQGNNTYTVPATAKYLILSRFVNGADVTPTNICVDGIYYQETIRNTAKQTNETIGLLSNSVVKNSIEQETVDLMNGCILLKNLTKRYGRFGSNGEWYNINASNTHSVFAVNAGDMLIFSSYPNLAFVTDYTIPISGEFAAVVSDFSGIIGTTNQTITVPSDAKYAIIMRDFSGEDRTPTGLLINGKNVNSEVNTVPLMADLADVSFEKQTACIHHDNFHRVTTGDPWNIGRCAYEDMYATLFPQIYRSYYTGDDGFRIVDNILVNDQTINIPTNPDGAGLRLIEASVTQMLDEILFEMSVPDNGFNSEFLFNFIDNANYETILVNNNGTNINFYWRKMKNGEITSQPLISVGLNGKSVGIQMNAYGMKLYIDGVNISPMGYVLNQTRLNMLRSIKFNKNLQVGIRIRKSQPYMYKYIALFNIVDFAIMNIGSLVDTGTEVNPYFSLAGTGHATLLTTNTCYSEKSQEFTLVKNEVTPDPVTARKEYADNSRLRINNLRRYKIAFDMFFPSEYQYDVVSDLVFQMHDRHNVNGKNLETVPPIGIVTSGLDNTEYLGFILRGCEWTDVENRMTNNDNETLMPLERNKWLHVELYVKEGYMPEHRPLTELFIDGKLVYRNHAINAFNRAVGTYARYGIYKAAWENESVREACTYDSKTVLIDNFIQII